MFSLSLTCCDTGFSHISSQKVEIVFRIIATKTLAERDNANKTKYKKKRMILKRGDNSIATIAASLSRDASSTTYMDSESVVSAMSNLSLRVQSLEGINNTQKGSITACIVVIVVLVITVIAILTIVALRYTNRVRASQGDEELAGTSWAMFSLGPTLNSNKTNYQGSLQRTLSDDLTPMKPIPMLDLPFSSNKSTGSQETLTTPYNYSKDSPDSQNKMYYHNQNGYIGSADTFQTPRNHYSLDEEQSSPLSGSDTTVSKLPPTVDYDYNVVSNSLPQTGDLRENYSGTASNDAISFRGDQIPQEMYQQHIQLEPIRGVQNNNPNSFELHPNPGGLEIHNLSQAGKTDSVMEPSNKLTDNRFTIDVEFDPFNLVSPKKIETFQDSDNYNSHNKDDYTSSHEVSPNTLSSSMDFPNTRSIANGFEYMREYLEGEGGIAPKDLDSPEDYSHWLPPAEPTQKYEPETRATSFYADTF